jgi:DMSO reductase family type II enzyme chaperone
MTIEPIPDVARDDERRAAVRCRAFRLFAELLDYPDEALGCEIEQGHVADALAETLGALDPDAAGALDREALCDALAGDELQVEYTRLFDAGGPGGPPCPLYGGLYGGARMQTMEEAVRFYNYFGLTLSGEPRELPDHLRTELEFLHYLAYREAEALRGGADAGPYRRAQRDFIERHPGRWVPKLRERVERNSPPRFIAETVRALERFLDRARADLA